MSLFLLLFVPFLGVAVVSTFPVYSRNLAAWFAAAVALVGVALTLAQYPMVVEVGVVRYQLDWMPDYGLNFVLRMDGLVWLFSLLIQGMCLLVVLYARYYMSEQDPVPRFFAFLLAFMAAMQGLVLSGNLIQLVVFWELTSLVSFLLIGYWHHRRDARRGARMALTVTAAGGLCLLLGMVLLGLAVGSWDVDQVLAAGDTVRQHPWYLLILLLVALGAFTKSAQFPFHFWLPQAMAAPTPVSAYLHSATMVKAGVFLLILLWSVMAGTDAWYAIVGTAGMATLLIGAFAAIYQHDLKGLLAYSTISHLGLITLLLGLGSPLAAVAAIFHTVNHATFKASLFMAAGIIDHETGTRDMRRLSGLYKFMPITATLAMVAAAAMAGVPLLNGFLSKEMFLAEALESHSGTTTDQLLPFVATIALAFSVFYSVRFIHQTFFGPPPQGLDREPHEAPRWMRLPIEVLVVACLVVGMFPAATVGPFLDIAVRSVLQDETPAYSLAIWHGFNQPLVLSIAALVLGGIGYYLFGRKVTDARTAPLLGRLKGRRMFETVLSIIIGGARIAVDWFGTRRLQPQLRILVLVACLAATLPFLQHGYGWGNESGTLVDPGFGMIWLIGGICAIGAAWQAKYHRLAALILVAGAGLVSCISFVWLSAPDLALTQLLVETVTTVLLLLGLRWLPKRLPDIWPEERTPWWVSTRRVTDFVIAVLGGVGMTLLA